MKGVILAAGKGSRISMRGKPKPLIPFLGLPLIERNIANLVSCGIRDFVVVVGYRADEVKSYVESLAEKYGINIQVIVNNEWDKENGWSVLKAEGQVQEPFVLIMSDHVYESEILESFLHRVERQPDGVILAVDYKTKAPGHIDLDDVTKVFTEDGKIKNIGKDIDKYNGFDTGLFFCSPVIFEAIRKSSSEGDTSLSGGIRQLAKEGKAQAFDIGDGIWYDVDTEEMFKKAEKYFLKKYNEPKQKINLDGPISRLLNRKISLLISRRLVYSEVTPMQVSVFSFILSVLAGLVFFLKGYVPLLLGGILAQISSVIDGVDGEIARMKNMRSEFGGWFDSVLDRYSDAFVLFGLAYHSTFHHNSFMCWLAGFLAIIGSFVNSYSADKYDGYLKKRLREGKKRVYFRVGRDLRVFIVFLGALANFPLTTLAALAALTNVENVRRIVVVMKGGKV